MKANAALVLAIVLALSTIAAPAALAGPVDAPTQDRPHVQSVAHLGGSSLAITARDGYAFVGSSAEFAVVDIQDVQHPRRVAYLPLAANDIVLDGEYAFVTNRSGLATIDLTAPGHPKLAASAPSAKALNGLAIAGHYAFAIAPEGGLFVYDVANPLHPQQVGFLRGSQLEGIAVQDGFAYLATSGGLRIVNVADPQRPTLTTFAGIPRPVEGVAVAGRYIYLSIMPGALLIADATDPAAPVLTGGVSLPTYTKSMKVVGDRVYVANGTSGVAVVDASDPQHPRLLTTGKAGALVTDVTADNDLVLATDVSEGGLHILRGSEPDKLTAVGTYRVPGVTVDAAALDRYVYLATGMDGDVTIVDYDDQANPAGVGFFRTPEHSALVRVHGERLCVYGENDMIRVMDITDPLHPADVGTRSLSAGVRLLAASDHHAFLADAGGMLHIYDTAASGMPQQVGLFAVAGEMLDAAMTGTYVLVAAGTQGVLAARYGGSTSAVPFQRIPIEGSARYIAATGTAAYVLTDNGILFTLDLSAPGTPAVTAQLDLGVDASALLLRDGRLFLPAGEDGVYVVDTCKDGTLGPVMVYETPGTALNVDVYNNRIFVADGYAGLSVLELAD
ncbi:MAG: hypothetical protein U0X20_18440 [Caldilineaceae bacterium]